MQTIRSFIAVPIAPEIQRRVRDLIEQLRGSKDGVKWVPVDNLHLTLKFLGEVDNRQIPEICQVIRRCAAGIGPFMLEVHGTGGFPDLERARVLWAGVTQGGEPLKELVARLEPALAELGFKPEPRDYRPHLTLGRMRTRRRISAELIEQMERYRDHDFGAAQVDQVQLYASFLDKHGPTYNVMDRVDL